jgi:hypothetical protein
VEKSVSLGDTVSLKYTGWLESNGRLGKLFESSNSSNSSTEKEIRFRVGESRVIRGWEEGVLGMRKTGRRLLVVPPDLAYGKAGLGDRVPSQATLVRLGVVACETYRTSQSVTGSNFSSRANGPSNDVPGHVRLSVFIATATTDL